MTTIDTALNKCINSQYGITYSNDIYCTITLVSAQDINWSFLF